MATATPRPDDFLARLEAAIAATGLVARGRLAVPAEDGLPPLPDGRPARTLFLVGRASRQGWSAFAASPESRDRRPDPLDRWSVRVIGELADRFGAAALYPFAGPPWWPFQRWAMRAEPVFLSPLGLLVHPVHGLWHAWRGALAFAEDLGETSPAPTAVSPCTACTARPCLTTCPVDAFSAAGYDVARCVAHLESPLGALCRTDGCRARDACPIGCGRRYADEEIRFLMRAFRAARSKDTR
ncbi:MAG: ferredoxin [Siculibacillus sp.]|nr:ferredoxin [Siculibacillus sp.]